MTGSARGFSFCGLKSDGFRFEPREGFGFASAVTKRNVRKKKTELQEQIQHVPNLYEAEGAQVVEAALPVSRRDSLN
jgi:hypothetical protein